MLAERASCSVSMMARVLGVSRSGFYRWPKAGGSGEDPRGPLKEAIIEIWDASERRFGLRKVWSKLTGDPKYGRFADTTPYRVRKCMSELGIRGICPNASRRTTVPDRDAPARPDLMGRDFPGPVPATKLVGDITYLRTEWYHHERPSDASTAKHGAIEFIESYYNRFRPHESIGDRVPAEAMQEFFDRFESALQADPEAMLAA